MYFFVLFGATVVLLIWLGLSATIAIKQPTRSQYILFGLSVIGFTLFAIWICSLFAKLAWPDFLGWLPVINWALAMIQLFLYMSKSKRTQNA